ncbi:hypothetical protein TruAng_008345 [Truncatella angustata]|nr:hypothetical protein TruAng_008345 [Truncatella angustata]
MWVLEHESDAFEGKRLWLRPGKRYLFGRTVAEPGMLAIHGEKSNSVSRKHITIEVDPVRRGDSQNLSSRSKVTVEDLKSKLGTAINGHKIKGERHVVTQETNELRLGSMGGFRIIWVPVVLSFSFTRRELEAGAQATLQENLEQLDIKFLADYDSHATTHVVNKKRNTSKGLQALVNGVYIVDDGFINTIVAAARGEDLGGGVSRSTLEGDFDAHWPDAIKFLPPPGNEPVPRPAEAFAPNPTRRHMFEGYTFIFYDPKQHESLIGPITDGKGKALYKQVTAHETQIDDFIRHVKSIAGEKGLGEFEDGSEGKGVVVVRYVPPNDKWWEDFFMAVSLRLDHRMIDQKDFLDAILSCDASGLRRNLEVETPHHSQNPSVASGQRMEVDHRQAPTTRSQASAPRRPVRTTKRRFRGFVADSDSDGDGDGDAAIQDSTSEVPAQPASAGESPQEGLFVSQDAIYQEPDTSIQEAQRSQRKRRAAQSFEDDFAPTAAQLKRRRIAAGQDPIPRQSTPEPESQTNVDAEKGKKAAKKSSTIKKEVDVIEVARQKREEADALAKAEREQLEADAEGLDLAEIRRLQIEEPMQLRTDLSATRTREQDISDGRWDPAWNGRKNFKKFRQRGAVEPARAPQRIIVALEEVKIATQGLGDDYWLEDESAQRRKKKSQHEPQSQATANRASQRSRQNTAAASSRQARNNADHDGEEDTTMGDVIDDHATGGDGDDDEGKDLRFSATGSRNTRGAPTSQDSAQTQRTTQKSQASRNTTKRPAAASPPREQPAKRSRRLHVPASDDDDDSDDELRFKFKRR